MRVAHSPTELDSRPRAVAIGTFDGVHRGHRSVIDIALAGGLPGTVVTFHPHPRSVMGNQVDLLSTLERRLELLENAGVDSTLVVTFGPELMRLAPEEFAEEYLRAIGAEVVVAGSDFRFGHRRSGDLELLGRLGFEVHTAPQIEGVSSSEIRRLLPDCPPERAEAIAKRATQRGSGRVGRTAAGRGLDPEMITLAVVASVRHEDTDYDDLLASGVGRAEARARVSQHVEQILDRWEQSRVRDLPEYQCGTWGPIEAERIIEADGRAWRNL